MKSPRILLAGLCLALSSFAAHATTLSYDAWATAVFNGTILPSDTYKCALVTSAYTPTKGTDQFWSTPVTNEVTGTGYTAGGNTVVPTYATNTTAHTLTITFPSTSWASSTITARGMVCYKSTGTNSTSPLVFYDDFGSNVSTTAGTFTVNASTITFNIP